MSASGAGAAKPLPPVKGSPRRNSGSPRRPASRGSTFSGRPHSVSAKARYVTSPRRSSRVFKGALQPHTPAFDRPEDTKPGPGQYAPSNSIGKQVYSSRRNASQFSFGTGTRDAYHRQFLTKELQAHMSNGNTAGVDFMVNSSVGKMVESKKETFPSFSFGTAPRDQYTRSFITKEIQARMPGKNTAGVDFVTADSSLSKKTDSRKTTAPSFGFGTSPRLQYERMYFNKAQQKLMVQTTTAKVDFVDASAGFGKKHDSRKSTAPSYGFGTAERGHRERMAMAM